MRLFSISTICSLCSLTVLGALSATALADPTVDIDFARDVLPILSDNCFTCHGPDENSREADLRLDTASGLLESHVVAAGEPAESELVRRLRSEDLDERMPPIDSKLTLTQAEIRKIEQWIEAGAKWSDHWAYQPLKRPPLPVDSNSEGDTTLRNPIDAFVRAKLNDSDLSPATEASTERLIRRVTLDLTGLPPTLNDVDALLNDSDASAYEKVVARLLSSPAYGERMAWPWLDAARYADTNGFQGDRERTMWPWRDWAVDAINRNMPFDRFTIMQLAGDQLPDATDEDRLATGFCRNHMINGEGGRIPAENRVEYIFDQIETVGTTWLGMTVQCCRCHDHKFDPISQDEYYKLFAFFNQTPVDGGGGNPQTAPVLTVSSRSQQRQIQAADSAIQNTADIVSKFENANDAIGTQLKVSAEEKEKDITQTLQTDPVSRSVEQLKQLEQLTKKSMPDYASLITNLRERIERRNQLKRSLPKVMVMEDMPRDKHRATHLLDRGLYNKSLHKVSAGVPAALPAMVNLNEAQPSRLDLANWLVDKRNPLTARVTVNRIWQTFFGAGIVESVEDFGLQAKRPSHPQLLDWLATELIRSDWDTKHIVELIVTSGTYRQSSKNSQSFDQDPENRLLARGPRFRMPAWMLRDQALSLSGLLVRQQGGPPVKPYQPQGVWADATFGNKRYEPDRGENLYRRSLYVFWRRIVGPTMFFDGGKRQTCEVKISRTNTPLHALATLNDVTYVEAARAMSERLFRDAASSDRARIKLAFRLATARLPSTTEQSRLLDRLATLSKHYREEESAAHELLSLGDSMRNQSIPAAEHAAYTCICLLILNLDETLTN